MITKSVIQNLHLILTAIITVAIPYALISYVLPITPDSGIFLYTGTVILDGGVPYLDSWDHKGPLLYLFNYFGILMFGNISGVFILEGTFLFLSLIICTFLWEKLTNKFVSLILALAFICSYFLTFSNGNLTETWLVPFLLITYTLCASYLIDKKNLGRYGLELCSIAIGITIAIALMTRANNAMGITSMALFFIFLNKHSLRQSLLLIISSSLIIIAPIAIWLMEKQAFEEFIQQYFYYNFFYIDESFSFSLIDRIRNYKNLLQTGLFTPLWLLSLLCIFYSFAFKQKSKTSEEKLSIENIFLIILILELISQFISGRGYTHYICVVLPAFVVFNLVFIRSTNFHGNFIKVKNVFSLFSHPLILIYIILLLIKMGGVLERSQHFSITLEGSPQFTVAEYLRTNTEPEDRIAIIGSDVWLLVASNRKSASRISYTYPQMLSFDSERKERINNIFENKPKYIIQSKCIPNEDSQNINCPDQIIFNEIINELGQFYKREKDIGNQIFWLRRDS